MGGRALSSPQSQCEYETQTFQVFTFLQSISAQLVLRAPRRHNTETLIYFIYQLSMVCCPLMIQSGCT